MGLGTSTQNTQQQSQTAPWQVAMPSVNGLFSLLNNGIGSTGVTNAQRDAFGNIINNAQGTSQFNPQINGVTSSLLNGGGAMNQAGNVNQNYQNYFNATNPLASNTNYDPMQTPGIGGQLQATSDAITQQINGQFAGAGRDMSGYNQKALGQGLAAGLAPILTNQYNTNVQNQQGAAGNLYNAGNTNAGLLSGLQQQYLGNQVQGIGQVGAGLDAQNAGNTAILQAESQRQGIPINQLGLLSQIGIPLAQLGTQSQGTSNTQSTASPIQQFGQIAQGTGNLFGQGKPFPSLL